MSSTSAGFSFPDEVRASFAFLKAAGFVASVVSPTQVRYESSKVSLSITHEQWDGEVAISFGRCHTEEDYSFTLFLRLVAGDLEKRLGERMARRRLDVRECLDGLAHALEHEGTQIVTGDDRVFERMKSVRWWDFRPDSVR